LKSDIYYSIQSDYRKCVSPICGGYWVSRLNHKYTICHDGSCSERCYIADISQHIYGYNNYNKIAIVRGWIESKHFDNGGEMGFLIATEVWTPGSNQSNNQISDHGNTFYSLQSTGIQCITTPCPTIKQVLLNRQNESKYVSGVVGTAGKEIITLLYSSHGTATSKPRVIISSPGMRIDGDNAVASTYYTKVPECTDI